MYIWCVPISDVVVNIRLSVTLTLTRSHGVNDEDCRQEQGGAADGRAEHHGKPTDFR